jgi:hypothetical protein
MGTFSIGLRTLTCSLSAIAALGACGSDTPTKTETSPAITASEGAYLDTVKGRSGPDWAPWPSDGVLIEQGHEICELLRTPGLMPQAVVFMFDPIPANMRNSVQANWQVRSAQLTIC